jgi:hypothetical protein
VTVKPPSSPDASELLESPFGRQSGIKFRGGRRRYAKDFKVKTKIEFDDHLPQWNYRAIPEFQ